MTVNYAQHKNILLQILKDIYSDGSLAPHLGFKGGTAAYLFYNLDRDSFDLDFDLLNPDKEEFVWERVGKIVSQYGRVVEAQVKKFNLLHIISYDSQAQNIKVDISKRNFGSRYEVKTMLGISMLVMVPADMFAHKLMAMLERVGKTSRDLYDVWYFLSNNWPINQTIVEQRAGVSFSKALQVCIEEIEKIKERNLLVGLGEALNDAQKDWARAKLKSDTIFLLQARLSS